MTTLTGKRTLVTGAASGIGRALAETFAAHGAELLLVDRNREALDAFAADLVARGVRARAYALDVTDTAGVVALRDRVYADGGPIDVLVNNAGIVFGGAFLDVPLAKHAATYAVNVLGLVAMTHTFLPDLIGRPEAHVVNVGSASGYIGLPFGATYASSKWAVIGFSESLQIELELLGHRHVHVTTACPSYVSTGLFAGVKAPLNATLLTADVIAAMIVRGVLANAVVVRAPWLVQVTPFLKGVLPFRLFYRVAAWLGANTSMRGWRGRPDEAGTAGERRSA